jgi:hypothetical protein
MSSRKTWKESKKRRLPGHVGVLLFRGYEFFLALVVHINTQQ